MVELPPGAVVAASFITELLAPTLGCEKSVEVVDAAMIRLGLSPQSLRAAQVFAVLDELARTPGMVGIAARFARSRLDAQRASAPPSSAVPPRPPEGAASAARPRATEGPVSSRSPGTTISTRDVATLLSSAMGIEKALEVVNATAGRLGIASDPLDKTQAIALLDQLAAEPGMVGLCARFGKARLILRFAA